ncbi:MAG: flagellar biosynthetic protein FliO [Desulfatiglandales bacterium]
METDLAANALKTAGSLLLILGLIICLFYVLKRVRFGSAAAPGLSRMRVLTTLSLAPKRSIAIVEVLNEWLVVGVGTDSITLLTRIDRPEELHGAETAGNNKAEDSFGSLLMSKIGRTQLKKG